MGPGRGVEVGLGEVFRALPSAKSSECSTLQGCHSAGDHRPQGQVQVPYSQLPDNSVSPTTRAAFGVNFL